MTCANNGCWLVVRVMLGFAALLPVVVYPLMKRVTYWPQAFLGTYNTVCVFLHETALICIRVTVFIDYTLCPNKNVTTSSTISWTRTVLLQKKFDTVITKTSFSSCTVWASWTIVGPPQTASSSAECSRDKLPFSFVRGQDSTMWDIVWVSPQGHRSVSVSRHFLLQAPQCPCFVRKRFSKDHCCRGRSSPHCQIVGSHTRWELTTWADLWCQLVASPATAASWMSVIAIVG